MVASAPVIIAAALLIVAVALFFIWRGNDVRVVLFVASLGIGALAGELPAVFRKTVETLADGRFVLPICSAMGFAYVVRATGCAEALVRLLLRPIARAPQLVVPGASSVAFVVNMAIPSQTSTLAAVGALAVPLLARLRTPATLAGTALVFGASIAGAVLNPGLAEVSSAAAVTALPAPELVVRLAPAALAAFLVGIAVLTMGHHRFPTKEPVPLAAGGGAPDRAAPSRYKAIFPPLPVAWLLLGHPALPWHDLVQLPRGLEVFTAMLAGSALVIAFAADHRGDAARAMFDGMGYAFAHVITIIAVSTGTAKALEVAGALAAFVDLAAGSAFAALGVVFALAFGLAAVSGSGTASSVALLAAVGPRTADLGVSPLAFAGVVLFAAEAGRTTSPVAAVLLFGSSLTGVPPRTLAGRLALPCLVGGAAGALAFVLAN